MNKLLLIRKIAEEFSINEETASEYIKNIFDTILRALSSGKNVNIAEFGKFILRNNKISFSPVKRFAQEINYNYAGLETIKIRNFNEKEFREKVNRLKRIEEEIEIQLGGVSPDAVEAYMRLPEPPLPKKQEIIIEKPKIRDDIFIREELPEEKEVKIPEDYIADNLIPEAGIPVEEDVTEEDIEEAVQSAIDEFLKLNFPVKEEKIPQVKIEPEEKIEEKEEILKTEEKPAPEIFSDFIIHKEPQIKEEEEIIDINKIIKEPKVIEKDITEAEPPEPIEDIQKFIIELPAGTGEEIKEVPEAKEQLEEITGEHVNGAAIFTSLKGEQEYEIQEITPDKTEEMAEQPKEFTEVMKDIEDKLAQRIEEAKEYKNKVFNQDKLAELIAEREKIIRDIKLTTDYTIEPFRPDEPEAAEEPHQEIKKEEQKTEDFKTFLIPPQGTGQKKPVKYPDISNMKTASELNIDDIIEEREKIIREIKKTSGFTAETYMTKEPLKFSQEYNTEEKKTTGFENFIIPPQKPERQEFTKAPEIPEKTENRALTYDEILEERRKFLEQEIKSPEMTVFDFHHEDVKKENEIDEYISNLDKIKDNLKTEEPGFREYIIPESNISAEELSSNERELISGDVKELHDEIIKPVEESIPEKSKNFNDVFIEDNKVIFYNTKETKASEEMYKKANLKSYDDVFFRFEADKKPKKSEPKKETNFLVVGVIWFVIVAAILTILALIFR